MIASRLNLPVVPVRLEGSIGSCIRALVKFGRPLRLSGDNYAALAKEVEAAVRDL